MQGPPGGKPIDDDFDVVASCRVQRAGRIHERNDVAKGEAANAWSEVPQRDTTGRRVCRTWPTP